MKLFIDTANVDDIRWANDLGVICGVTTNPSLIAKEGRVFEEVVKEITTIVDGPISAEVISLEADKMVEEALPLAAIHKNIVIKLPMCEEGLKACKMLFDEGVYVNPVLPPATPVGECLIRTSYTATHTKELMDEAADKILKVFKELGIVKD